MERGEQFPEIGGKPLPGDTGIDLAHSRQNFAARGRFFQKQPDHSSSRIEMLDGDRRDDERILIDKAGVEAGPALEDGMFHAKVRDRNCAASSGSL